MKLYQSAIFAHKCAMHCRETAAKNSSGSDNDNKCIQNETHAKLIVKLCFMHTLCQVAFMKDAVVSCLGRLYGA